MYHSFFVAFLSLLNFEKLKNMKVIYPFIFFFGLFLWSCKSDSKNAHSSQAKQDDFNFSQFTIQKGQLGNIKLGMTIQEAEKQFSALDKKIDSANDFGLDGGSSIYLYYHKKEALFGLIPKLLTDTLYSIIVLDPKFKTIEGLHKGSSVNEILKVYPHSKAQLNWVNGNENIVDTTNHLYFVFQTQKGKQVGDYSQSLQPSEPKNLSLQTDWIEIAPKRYW
ncbi:hypothetical protein AD998_16195 [bacterium 336/3]|nr:hypothetical protein AD998_16195 [bacterium 336/3]